jgi:hypothetical protein
MQFNGKADPEIGRGKTQINEDCRWNFLCLSPARRKQILEDLERRPDCV